MNKARVLFVGTVSLDKLDSGKKVFIAGLVKYFLDNHDRFEFHYYQIAAGNIGGKFADSPQRSADKIKINLTTKIKNVLIDVLLMKRTSFQEALLYSSRVGATLNMFVSFYQPTIIIFDTIRAQRYRSKINTTASCIFYGEDLFSIRYAQMISELAANRDLEGIAGAFSDKIPAFAVKFLNSSKVFQKILLSIEISRVSGSEARAVSESQLSLYLNFNEVQLLRNKFPDKCIQFLPPYPARDLDNTGYKRQFDDNNLYYLIVANWGIPQNVSGFLYVVKECWPIVKSKLSNAQLKIVGPHSEKLTKFLNQNDAGVDIAGWVDDLSAEYGKCCAALLPTTFGTGLKLKLIEALTFGVPVVSTTLGVSGTPLSDTTGVTSCRTPQEFAHAMCRLSDRIENMKASESSGESYKKFYSRDHVAKSYDELFK